MRNVFDQYDQPENRITHALLTALNEDRRLLASFLRDLAHVTPPTNPAKLTVLEQQYPGEAEASEDELERRGIPDGWIFDDEQWCIFIESKVLARITLDQITRHRRTAERMGFRTITAIAIAATFPQQLTRDGVVLLEWPRIYAWLHRKSSEHVWAARVAKYLEIAEAKMLLARQYMEGTLTMFAGFPFGRDHPITYLEAKRVLALAMGELRNRRDLRDTLGMRELPDLRPQAE